MRRTYKYKASLSRMNATAATRQLGLYCELYNAALQERRDAFRLAGVSITQAAQSRQLPEIKQLRPDVSEIGSQVLHSERLILPRGALRASYIARLHQFTERPFVADRGEGHLGLEREA
jgi:hypothetical protein